VQKKLLRELQETGIHMNVFYIFKKIPHHSAHSGYDQIIKYVPSKCLSPVMARVIERALRVLPELKLRKYTWVGGWYRNESLAKEILVALNFLFRKGIYHYLYGEDDFHWGGDLPFRSGSRIAVTFHQPPSVFEEVIKDKTFISKADAIIACATNQVEYLEKITERKNIYFVPHGVDTGFFVPLEDLAEGRRFTAISVGWWLRDVVMIREVIEKANRFALDIEFDIVTFPEYFEFYKGLRNVSLACRISHEELRRKYQKADVLLLPMKDCTANNAVLEAMACGTPVMSTDVGGMKDYVDETCGFLARPGDGKRLLDVIVELMKDSKTRLMMGKAAREKAETFDWRRVAEQMISVYRLVAPEMW
jgi:glycosyltransferase involved in cell wall biosynthesis